MKQEFTRNGFHRLVEDNGHPEIAPRVTGWAAYSQWTFLEGQVGVTDYFTGQGERIITPEELAAYGVGSVKE